MGSSTAVSQRQLTPMMRQYAKAKAAYPDALVLFRLGDFYELFEDDAQLASRLLELVLTSREAGKGRRVPMCGVPVHAVESYIARLLEAGHKVAVCEQMEDARLTRGLVRREVVRLLTPGTVVEESMLEEGRNNFLAALHGSEQGIGLATLDVSTGEFWVTTLAGGAVFEALQTELARLRPAECLLSPSLHDTEDWQSIQKNLSLRQTVCEATAFDLVLATQRLDRQFGPDAVRQAAPTPLAVQAAGAVLDYLQVTHQASLPHLTCLHSYRWSDYLVLDAITRRNLELVRTLRHGERRGSVLEVLDETVTAMGARLLRRWLEQPLLQLDAIVARQDAVAELVADGSRRQALREALRGMYDMERVLGRIACGTANARQLTALRSSLASLPAVRGALVGVTSERLRHLGEDCTGEADILRLLQEAIVDDPPITLRDGHLIRPGYDARLDRLLRETDQHTEWIARLQARERRRTGIKSLKVRYNQVFGYYIEVSKANLQRVPDDYVRKQTLSNGERFMTEALKDRETAILQATEHRVTLEYDLFVAVRERIAQQSERLQRIAAAVAQLDALASLAHVAVLYDYSRPTVEVSDRLVIRQGRHPVVERVLDGFVPNDLLLEAATPRLVLLTGPNMAGKSTYLRQTALIAILAQMGSFVPAAEAIIGLVDRVFTRVGAVDDIAAGRSTFLVEMSETAHILHNATRQSLVILDEIGKGTSTFEGLSIAWAVALYMVRRLEPRALFATHYHELTALESLYAAVKNFHMAVRETAAGIVFLRQVLPGGAGKSYGLHVARLAGLPAEVVDEAGRLLTFLERQRAAPSLVPATPSNGASDGHEAAGLQQRLAALDICQMTPLQALTVLHDLQQQARGETSSGRAVP